MLPQSGQHTQEMNLQRGKILHVSVIYFDIA
jgi:hypothetical protein